MTVLIQKNKLGLFPSQTLVEIDRKKKKKTYRGIVIEGPFHEPDGLKADAPIMVTSAVNGMSFIPNYHGRVHVEILGEYQEGQFEPPRYRPLPNSPVKALGSEEINKALQLEGDLKLGLLYGHDKITVGIPSDSKMVLPRHLGVLGTTGGGKSTTVSGLIKSLQDSNVAVILFDTEG